jgi:hypothetical protein
MRGNLCRDKGVVFRTKFKHFMSSTMEGDGFAFQDGKLFRITVYIPNEDWDKVRFDLSEKLGPPAKEVPQVFQNGFGARWEYEQAFWQKDDVVAFAKIKVATIGGSAIRNPATNLPDTEGIEVTITDAEHAKLPSTLPNSLD